MSKLGVALVAYSPLGRGFLTGTITSPEDLDVDDWRRNSARFQAENLRRNLELVERVNEIATEHGATPAQISLSWVLAQGDDVVPIPGTRRIRFLEENVGALDVELTPAELARIDQVIPSGAASGERYAPHALRAVNR